MQAGGALSRIILQGLTHAKGLGLSVKVDFNEYYLYGGDYGPLRNKAESQFVQHFKDGAVQVAGAGTIPSEIDTFLKSGCYVRINSTHDFYGKKHMLHGKYAS